MSNPNHKNAQNVGNDTRIEKKKPKRKEFVDRKPTGFAQREDAVKQLMKSKRMSYFEMIDEHHTRIIVDFTVNNIDEIGVVVEED